MRPVCGYFAALLGVVAFALTACATADPSPTEYLPTPATLPPPRMADAPEGIRLFADPSHTSQIIAVLPLGWEMRAVRRDREWVLIKPTGGEKQGWVYAPLPLAPPKVASPAAPPAVTRGPQAAAITPQSTEARAAPKPLVTASAPLPKKTDGDRQAETHLQTDAEIIAWLIRKSQVGYPGPCACPDNVNRAGRRCGNTSAYVQPGGWAPLCYPADVTPAMIAAERARRARVSVQDRPQ